MSVVSQPVSLVTFVELEELDGSTIHFSARLVAILSDGRRVMLLDDRGWSSRRSDGRRDDVHGRDREDIERSARMVVGPDEAYGGRSQEDMEEGHWAHLAGVLAGHGVVVDAAELRVLPHQVVLGERLRFAMAEADDWEAREAPP